MYCWEQALEHIFLGISIITIRMTCTAGKVDGKKIINLKNMYTVFVKNDLLAVARPEYKQKIKTNYFPLDWNK